MNEAYGVNPRVSVLTSQRSTTMSPLVDVGLTCPLDLLPSLLNLAELPRLAELWLNYHPTIPKLDKEKYVFTQ